MAQLYADEDFDYDVVIELRGLGHDVVTVQEAGNASGSDAQVLAYAMKMSRDFPYGNRLRRCGADSNLANHDGSGRQNAVPEIALHAQAEEQSRRE